MTEEDDRIYYLVAENDRGQMRESLRLEVTDPISMETVIGKYIINIVIKYRTILYEHESNVIS